MEIQGFDFIGVCAVVGAALRTGLLMELSAGAATIDELAGKLGLDRRALALALDVLATGGLARREGDRFAPGELLLALSAAPGGNALSLGLWAHLETFLRTGQPFVQMDLKPREREEAYRDVVGGLGRMFDAPARALAASLPVTPRRILDVGCGSGVWSLALAARLPEARVAGLDLPAVLESFTARAGSLGLAGRIDRLPGDMHEVELPRGAFDLVIVANVLRLEPPARARALIDRLVPSLASGGALMIVDALATGTPERDRARAVYAMHLGLRTREGQVHSPATISGWLAHAGLPRVESLDVADGVAGVGALLARAWATEDP